MQTAWNGFATTIGAVTNFDDLTPEQKEKAKAAKTPEEILALAKSEGYELSLDDLEGVSGGEHWACNCDEGYSYNPVN